MSGVSWTKEIFLIHIHAILLSATCFPLMYHDNTWMERFDSEMEVHKKNYDEITGKMIKNLNNLYDNRVSNGYRFFREFLDTTRNNNGLNISNRDLSFRSYLQLNLNFVNIFNENDLKYSVEVVESTNVYYRSPNLFYYNYSGNLSIIAGLGKRYPKYSCDEDNELVKNKLTCFKIGDSHISYHGDNVESFYTGDL